MEIQIELARKANRKYFRAELLAKIHRELARLNNFFVSLFSSIIFSSSVRLQVHDRLNSNSRDANFVNNSKANRKVRTLWFMHLPSCCHLCRKNAFKHSSAQRNLIAYALNALNWRRGVFVFASWHVFAANSGERKYFRSCPQLTPNQTELKGKKTCVNSFPTAYAWKFRRHQHSTNLILVYTHDFIIVGTFFVPVTQLKLF